MLTFSVLWNNAVEAARANREQLCCLRPARSFGTNSIALSQKEPRETHFILYKNKSINKHNIIPLCSSWSICLSSAMVTVTRPGQSLSLQTWGQVRAEGHRRLHHPKKAFNWGPVPAGRWLRPLCKYVAHPRATESRWSSERRCRELWDGCSGGAGRKTHRSRRAVLLLNSVLSPHPKRQKKKKRAFLFLKLAKYKWNPGLCVPESFVQVDATRIPSPCLPSIPGESSVQCPPFQAASRGVACRVTPATAAAPVPGRNRGGR